MSDTTEKNDSLKVTPYRGTVTARFSDALVASTDKALLVEEEDKQPAFYFPFEDIYFEFFEKSPTREECAGKGLATFWSVRAVGAGADDILWTFENPTGSAVRLRKHAAFAPDKIDVEANAEEDLEHRPHLP